MKKSQYLTAAVSGIFLASASYAAKPTTAPSTPTTPVTTDTKVKEVKTTPPTTGAVTPTTLGECHGLNTCKGAGECGGDGHECAGQNACKGKGWKKMTKKDCDAKKGKFVASK